MRAKYGCGPVAMPEVRHHSSSSRTWRGIVACWSLVKGSIRWIIRDGLWVSFWKDKWLPGIFSLQDLLGSQIPVVEQDFAVSNYATSGGWDWDRIRRFVSDELCQKIAIIKPSSVGLEDFPSWDPASNGQFSLKTAYQLVQLESCEVEENEPIFYKVWHWKGTTVSSSVMESCS